MRNPLHIAQESLCIDILSTCIFCVQNFALMQEEYHIECTMTCNEVDHAPLISVQVLVLTNRDSCLALFHLQDALSAAWMI